MKYNKNILLNVILPTLIGICILYGYKSRIRKAEDIDLGEGTKSYYPYKEKYPLHINNPGLFPLMKEGWEKRGSKDIYLWLGNSQLHGVNQYREGNSNSTEFLFNCLAPAGYEVLAASYPNANMQEFLVSVLYYSNELRFKGIVLPFFYDDMRENGIRDILSTGAVINMIKNDSAYFAGVESIEKLKLKDTATLVKTNGDFNAIRETAQDISERYFNTKLENSWDIWRSRPDFRGNMFVDLYNLRNMALGIKSSTIRKMISRNYQQNYMAFLLILKYCTDKKIPLWFYIPPIRNDAALPYDMNAYADFKKQVEKDCTRPGTKLINLEKIVPGQFWGLKRSTDIFNPDKQLDFMHFQQKGHQLLADTICKVLVSSK